MFYVEPDLADEAWRDGAWQLERACKRSDGDTDGAALLADIKAGRKTLIGHGGAWAVVQVQEFPLQKVLHIDAIHAPGMTSAAAFGLLQDFARHNGCAFIQGACQPAVARLWAKKFGFRPAYQIMRKEVTP